MDFDSPNSPSINAVYYPPEAVYDDWPPSKLRVRYTTHIFCAFAEPNRDGTLHLKDHWVEDRMPIDGERGCLRALRKLKENNPHLTTILSIGGASGSHNFPSVAARVRARVSLARDVQEFVDYYSLDGVDVNWVQPSNPADGANFIHLLHMLRTHLPEPQYVLSAALPASADCLKHIDLSAASRLLDYLNLTAYDFSGPWSPAAGHNAQLFPSAPGTTPASPSSSSSCQAGVNYLVGHGFSRCKILLGVPAYARSFRGAAGAGMPYRDCGEMRYADVPERWVEGATVDERVGAAWFVDEARGGKSFVSLEVPATVRQKARYVKDMGLAGLFYYNEVSDLDGANSLVVAGRKGLDEL